MNEILITIPGKKIKIKTASIKDAIVELKKLEDKRKKRQSKIISEFAGIVGSSGYSASSKTDWYNQ